MSKTEEIIKELRQIRMQIAFIPPGEERAKLSELADKLHDDYASNLFKEKTLERKRGR